VVDRAVLRRESGKVMDDEGVKPRRSKRLLRRLLVLVILAGCMAAFVNGPGMRWLAPKIAAHYAGKAGIALEFELRGNLRSGLTVHGLVAAMPGQAVERVTIDELEPIYRLPRLIRGEIQGVRANGVHVEVSAGGGGGAADAPSRPVDFGEWVAALRGARERVIGLELDFSDVTVSLDRPDMPALNLGTSALRHAAGESLITLQLGDVTRNGEVFLASQAVHVDWAVDRLGIDRIAAHPELVLTKIALAYPEDGGFSVEGVADFAGAVFQWTGLPEQAVLALHLREGALDLARVGEIVGVESPATGRLTSLTLDAGDFFPDPRSATATLGLLIEDVQWAGRVADELSIDVVVDEDSARWVGRAASGGAVVRVDATAPLDRAAMRPGRITGSVEVPALADAVGQFVFPDAEIPAFPQSEIRAEFHADLGEDLRPTAAALAVDVLPEEPEAVGGFRISADWADAGRLAIAIAGDGLRADGTIDTQSRTYAGEVWFEGFETSRHEPWLAAAGIDLPGVAVVDAFWRGSGPFLPDGHEGELQVANALWRQDGQPDLALKGHAGYAHPGRVTIHDLHVSRAGQAIRARMDLGNHLLNINQFVWTDADDTELAEMRGSLPVPRDFSKWREFLSADTRPLDLTLRTRVLGFDKIATWLPALDAVDPRTTGELGVLLGGTLADPELEATLNVRGLRAVERPDLPPADLSLTLRGRDNLLTADGRIVTPDFAPAKLSARLPFAPAAWAEDSGVLMQSDFEATADLPRIDLSRFAAMIPAARNLTGTITGNVRAGGTIGEPEIAGGIRLAGGSLRLVNESVPPVTGIAAEVDFDRDRATLRTMRATMAGGTLVASGTFAFPTRELDFRVRGNSLPLVRNAGLIIRANADVTVAGPWDAAAVSGSISLVDSLLFRDIEILPIGTPFTMPQAAALPKIDTAPPTASIPEPFSNWPLDVRFTTAEPLLIRGNLATGRILADLRVAGTVADPRPQGTVRLLRGRAALPFSTLAVPEAVFTFSPQHGLDPLIEARGSAEPRPYTVNIYAHGRLSDPQIVLTSTPPLPQNEIMTLLATGTTTRGLENPQMASARAIQLFGEEIRRGRVPMSNQLRPFLGLFDRVDFTVGEPDPYSSETYSTATLQLHDRWYLSAGMGAEGNTRMFAIWRLRFR